jgi:hypothetical protein
MGPLPFSMAQGDLTKRAWRPWPIGHEESELGSKGLMAVAAIDRAKQTLESILNSSPQGSSEPLRHGSAHTSW